MYCKEKPRIHTISRGGGPFSDSLLTVLFIISRPCSMHFSAFFQLYLYFFFLPFNDQELDRERIDEKEEKVGEIKMYG